MEGNILFDISHLRFDKDGAVRATVNDGMFVMSNEDIVRETFFTDTYKKQYGIYNTSYIPKSVFAYSKITIENTDRKIDEQIQMEFEEMMFERVQYLESLLTFLWFVKDNSVGLYSTIGQIPAKNIVGSLSKSIGYWNCGGNKENVLFTDTEIIDAANLTFKYREICGKGLKRLVDSIIPTEFDQHKKPHRHYLIRAKNDFNYNEQNCIERALNFLIIARSQSYIIYKIAYYIAVLECLFTTNSSEITMRMSYRIAFYIGESMNECHKIFKTVYDAYDIRSRFLHGQKFKSDNDIKIETLTITSKELDNILRRAFRKIFESPAPFSEYTNEDRDSYLNSLIFDLPFERKNTPKNKKC